MPDELKEYPNDFYHRAFSVIVVNRKDSSKPVNFEQYAEMLNLKLSLIQALAFTLGAMDKHIIATTDPENLKAHINDVVFLILSLSASMHLEGELETFLRDFE